MAEHKLLHVMNKLLERSKLGEVDWNASEEEHTYVVRYSHASFSISSDEMEPNYYCISAINEDAVTVDSLWFQDLDDDSYSIVEELYALAKRKSLNVDKVLDALLEEIER